MAGKQSTAASQTALTINDAPATTTTMTITGDAYDDVDMRLEQVIAMIDALRIQIADAEEVAVSTAVLSVALGGYSTFIDDIKNLLFHAVHGSSTKAAGAPAP